MKILHCCLSNFYIDGYNYQENVLPFINKMDGHEVEIIASTETFLENSKLDYIEPGIYFTEDGIKITRVPYKKYLPHFIMKKVRHYKNVYALVEKFSPDVILFHGVPAYEILTIARYKKNNPMVKFYVDSHEDKNNSGTNWLSKNVLHKFFYRNLIKKAHKFIDKIFYITYETNIFLREMYHIQQSKMEFFPLGGVILNVEERNQIRNKLRKELCLVDDDILLVHSGKLDKLKRTAELIEAFLKANKSNLKLVIIGSIPEQQRYLEGLIQKDNKITYVGWKTPKQLMEYLCACDLYVQPGSQSATMQSAICCGSAALLYPYESHKHLLGDSVFYIETVNDMVEIFKKISEDPKILKKKRLESYEVAKEKLDYKKLAARLYK